MADGTPIRVARRVTLVRVLVTTLAVIAVAYVIFVLAFSSILAHPTSGSGEGRFPGGSRGTATTTP